MKVKSRYNFDGCLTKDKWYEILCEDYEDRYLIEMDNGSLCYFYKEDFILDSEKE
jgi:hypothetical protein